MQLRSQLRKQSSSCSYVYLPDMQKTALVYSKPFLQINWNEVLQFRWKALKMSAVSFDVRAIFLKWWCEVGGVLQFTSRLSILLVSLQILLLAGTSALAQTSGGSTSGTIGGGAPPATAPAVPPGPGGLTPAVGNSTGQSSSPTAFPADGALPLDPTADQLTSPGGLDQRSLPSDASTEAARGAGPLGSESLLTQEERVKQKEIPIGPMPVQELIPIGHGKLPPIKLEATYNQPIGLREVLQIALENALPIKISRAGLDSQKYLYYASLGRFLPDFNMIYRTQNLYPEGGSRTQTRTLSSTVRFPVFQGGRVFYGALANYHRLKGARFGYSATINDTLLDVYRRYNDLLLNEVLLQIRLKSVEVSRAQLRLNQQLMAAGTGTNFAVMQSTTQLALDRQALLQQQVAVRQSALGLAAALNINVGINLIPLESRVREARLVDPTLNIAQLTDIAMRNRPELGQSNENRLAQTRQVQVALAPLMPTAQFFLTANRSETERSGGGSSGGAGGGTNLGALAATGTSGFGVGGSPVAGVGLTGIGGASSVVIPAGGGGGAGISVGGSTNQSFTAGFDINWNLTGLGVPDTMNALSQRALARQAMLQYNQQAITVLTQVRASYLATLTAEEQVDVTGEAVIAAQEGLRLANLRLQHGVGTNLELIQAQRDYVTALINQAQAIIAYNISQAQLLRDTGQISLSNLTNEVTRPISHEPLKSKFFQNPADALN